MNPDDADRAAESGVAGIIVSNHGGRNLDTLPATIDALPQVADKVAGRIPVFVDGGIRRGTDVLKALVFHVRLGYGRTSGRPKARAFAEFLVAQFPEKESTVITPQETASRIIVP